MSVTRVPEGVQMVLLTLHYQDGFCTIQAIWDEANILRLESKGNCIFLNRSEGLRVLVRRTEKSQKITRDLTVEIAKRWLAGDYVKVESALIPGYPSKDWMS